MSLIIICCLLGIIPAAIANAKGRSFVGWWIFGALLFIVALPLAILAPQDNAAIERDALASGMKKCPACAELIKQDRISYRHAACR
ncbi:hypothetical protein [Xanthomonas arboricola]|uniref:hypothetical protein n=1 Tax=Xanthomonas arboricola TaxID=56448 RepID=UPI00063E8E4D|nr:hypothetical protein [Xanthomonas arboricola]